MKNKPISLSNSAINTYTDCPHKFDLYYNKRIRTNYTKSSFLFGGAIDSAVEVMLLNKKNKTHNDPYLQFLDAMHTSNINGESVVIYKTTHCKFTKGDVDLSLLSPTELVMISEFMKELGYDTKDYTVKDFWEYYDEATKKKQTLEVSDFKIFSAIAFHCLVVKGQMFIPLLQKWIDINVAEVIEVQKHVEVLNEHGDRLHGYLDFVVKLKNGKKALMDLKTSSDPKRDYPEGCVEVSQQLSIYYDQIDVDIAGYLVVNKKVKKKDPKIELKTVFGKISEDNLNIVFDKIEEVLYDIKQEIFPKNEASCFAYGGCDYFNLCKKGNMKGLVKLETK